MAAAGEWSACSASLTWEDDAAVCGVRGDVDASSVRVFRQAIAPLALYPRSVLDLSKVAFMDSAGLGTLVWGLRRVREAGADLVLVASRPHVVKLLRTVGVTRIVPVVASAAEATAALRWHAKPSRMVAP